MIVLLESELLRLWKAGAFTVAAKRREGRLNTPTMANHGFWMNLPKHHRRWVQEKLLRVNRIMVNLNGFWGGTANSKS